MRFVTLILAVGTMTAQTGEYERARQLLTSGHAAEAVAIYRELSRAHPDNADLLLNLSIAEYQAGDFREAAGSAAAALNLQPDLLPASLFLGSSYLQLGEFNKAIGPLERVIAADPKERNGRLMLGEALLAAGRPAEAMDHFQAAAAMLPDNSRVWYGLGRAFETLGRRLDAREAWARLQALPPSLESRLHAAEVHDAEHRWREAAVEWREAMKLAPSKQAIRLGLAWSLFRSRDYDAAMATLKPLLSSESADVPFLYGASLLNLQRPAEAMPYLRAAIAINPGLLPARAALGQALLQMGKPAEAIPFLEEGISVDRDGAIHFQLFRAYQLTQQKADAQRALAAYQRLRASLPAVP